MMDPERRRAAQHVTKPAVQGHAHQAEDALAEAVAELFPEYAEAVLVRAARRLCALDRVGYFRFLARRFRPDALEDALRETCDAPTFRALRLLADVLGRQAPLELVQEGRVVVASRDGRRYAVGLDGEVRDLKTWAAWCVQVRGPRVHDVDAVIAKALTIRDRPEDVWPASVTP